MFLDDTRDLSLCSKSTPFLITTERLKNFEKYVASNYTCHNGYQDAGCLCMTKNQKRLLETRGNNSTTINH